MNHEFTPKIKSTGLSFEILEAIHDENGATLPQLVDRFDKPESTIHDHLSTLSGLGYLTKEGRTYELSVRFLNLGGRVRAQSPFFRVGEGEVRKLARDTGEHANMMVEENGLGIFLYKDRGQQAVTLDTYEGKEVYLHTTALGKAILAELSDSKREAIIDTHGLAPVTEKTITDRHALDDELARIRERGYAIDDEERIEGIRCVAAPVTTDDRVVGAVSISAPTSRMTGDRFEEEIPSKVLSSANIIEVNIQHS